MNNKNILIVEDEPVISMVTGIVLSNIGYNIYKAATGEAAIKSALQNDIDLVLMDINLGTGIDGTEAAREILKHKNLPIVFHTSHTEEEYVNKVKMITKYGYVIKNSGEFVLRTSIEVAFDLFAAHKDLDIKSHDLRERNKELKCLNEISGIIEKNPTHFDEIVNNIIDIIPNAFQYPELTGVEIIIGNKNYATTNFKASQKFIKSDIKISDLLTGEFKVYLSDNNGKEFLKEEQDLINIIAERLSRVYERYSIHDQFLKENKLNKNLLSFVDNILEKNNFEQTARFIFDKLKEAIGVKAGYVALISDDGTENKLLFLDDGGFPCFVNKNLPMPVRGLRAEAYKNGKAVYDNDFMNNHWVKLMPKGHMDLPNVLFAPLNIDEKTLGIIGVSHKYGGFTEEDAAIATNFAKYASLSFKINRFDLNNQ